MSGRKSMDLLAGAASVLTGAIRATGEVMVAGAEVGVAAVGVVQAYLAKQQREQEKARLRQQRVEEKRQKLRSQAAQKQVRSKVVVKLPKMSNSQTEAVVSSKEVAGNTQSATPSAADVDAQRRAERLAGRLPQIQQEYQPLIDQQVLDASTVGQALAGAKKALNQGKLADAEAHLQALDEARIQASEQLKPYWRSQMQYARARLDAIKPSVPAAAVHSIQTRLEGFQDRWQQMTEEDLTSLHEQISELEEQSDRIQEATKSLLYAWQDVGYTAQFLAYDDGDAVIEVDTHEEAATQMRVQFSGQGLDLLGPPEDTPACAARTKDALRLFQEQGYFVEWNALDGEAVPEDWRRYYSATAQPAPEPAMGEDAVEAITAETPATEVLATEASSAADSTESAARTPANKARPRAAEGG